jgi:hypothetical protein
MQDRQSVRDFYLDEYTPPQPASGWSGDVATCNAGDTSAAFKTAMLRRINFYRAMAGIPTDVTFTDEYNRKAQQAALMMSANRMLSHTPSSDWQCYTAEGYEAAGSANLFGGTQDTGISVIDAYIKDSGPTNTAVGHRRWLLYPQAITMGTGDIPAGNSFTAANALWVFGERSPTRNARDEFVAWPPPGFVPYQLVYPRWSFALPDADFGQATVEMQQAGQAVAVQIQPIQNGFGEHTLVWEAASTIENWTATTPDRTYEVSIRNVQVDGQMQDYRYTVTVFVP